MKRTILLGCFLLSTAGTYAADKENKQSAEKSQLEIELTDEERRAVVSEEEEADAQKAFIRMFAYNPPEINTPQYLKACADQCYADIRPKIAAAKERKRAQLLAQAAAIAQANLLAQQAPSTQALQKSEPTIPDSKISDSTDKKDKESA